MALLFSRDVTSMKSKELSPSVKQAIVRLKNQNKPIREIAKTLGVAKSTVGYILKKIERTGELSNTKRPGRPRKTTVVDDRRIISLVKKNPFTTVGQIKNTLQEVGVSVSKSTIKRRLHQSKYRGFTTRCKPLITEELDKVKQEMEEKGSSMSDGAPVVKIKQSLTKLKQEIVQMDIRIGVVEHTLLQAKLKEKSNMTRDMHATNIPEPAIGAY
ncbi:intraflagellar transport protein 57 homolog isoform X1 [Osmerus mordax]|uniref:intraflagellar transport protein 57 homolog isoform X1 n=1 Tax=Osmerus mordax TaxID=8014 RepID=UPI0035101E3E